jgi:hypothetical protein
MDYFNQYTYAEVSANMISEIAYTETLTFWSTLISAPLIYFGSLGVANTVGKHANEEGARRIGEMVTRIKGQFVSNVLKAPIMEIFDEIIKDSFLESIGEVAASYAGWSEDAGFLLGTLLTSARELGGALGKIVLGGDKNMKNNILIAKAAKAGDAETALALRQEMDQQHQAEIERRQQEQDDKKLWQKIFGSNMFKGFFMMGASMFLGGFSFLTLSGFKDTLKGSIDLSPKLQSKYRTLVNKRRKDNLIQTVGEQPSLNDVLQEKMKKPSNLEDTKNELLKDYKKLQESNPNNPMSIDTSVQFISNPKTETRQTIITKYASGLRDAIESFNAREAEKLFAESRTQTEIKEAKVSDLDSEVNIEGVDNNEGLLSQYNLDTINFFYSKLFEPESNPTPPRKLSGKILYPVGSIYEAKEFLSTIKYKGLDIFIGDSGYNNINPEIQAIIQAKRNKGEELSKLERIIADVAVFFMGGKQPTIDKFINGEKNHKEISEKKESLETFQDVKVESTLDNEPALPPREKRIVSRDHGGNTEYSQDFLKEIWKRGKYKDQYIFGMIYMWTHEKTGKTYMYPGRTEQRLGSGLYRPYSSISVRFQQEIDKAIYNDPKDLKKKRNQMYYDMHMVYKKAGGGQEGIDAIIDNFDLKIVEILPISDDYDADCKMIERYEDYWMDIAGQIGVLYAAAGGHAGGHVAEERSGHAQLRLENKINDLLKNGFSKRKLQEYLKLTTWKLETLIKLSTEGKTYTEAIDQSVSDEIFGLVDSGVFTIKEFAAHLEGLDEEGVLLYLTKIGRTRENLYLKGLISSLLLTSSPTTFTYKSVSYGKILRKLGIPPGTRDMNLKDFMLREMKLKNAITRDDLIFWIRPYARMMVKHFNTPKEFLDHLGLGKNLINSRSIKNRIDELFGMSFKRAKELYSGFIGDYP